MIDEQKYVEEEMKSVEEQLNQDLKCLADFESEISDLEYQCRGYQRIIDENLLRYKILEEYKKNHFEDA